MPTLKRGQWQLQEEGSGPWHPTPQINCCTLGPARETGPAWKGKPGTRQECGPLGGAINSQRESEGLQGRGCGGRSSGKGNCRYSQRESEGLQGRGCGGRSSGKGNCRSSAQGGAGHSPQCIDMAGVRDRVFREEHGPPPNITQKISTTRSSPHYRSLGAALIPHFHPFGHPGIQAITQPLSQAGTLRTIQRC